jgi:glucosamine-6-phosphate deaminase
MEQYNLLKPEELGVGSTIKLDVSQTEVDIYWKVAMEVLELISDNNRKGEPTVMVVPYGPLGPYFRLAHLVNKYRVSLENCVFINMDEYLADEKTYIDVNDPLSFRGGMDRIFYNVLDEELNVLPENRIFPEPGNEGRVLEIIQKYGKLDMVFGGVGINGHYAFNEPPEPGETVSNEEFANRPTRVLKISRETRTINAYMNCGADLNAIPEYCITVGMKEMFMARKIIMIMPRDWNAGALRKILHGEVTASVPCSLFRSHPDATIYTLTEATKCPIPEIRVYNK